MPASSVLIAALLVGETMITSFVIAVTLGIAGFWLGALTPEAHYAESKCPETPDRAVCQAGLG